MKVGMYIIAGLALLAFTSAIFAQGSSTSSTIENLKETLANLEAEMEAVKSEYRAQIDELKHRLDQIEKIKGEEEKKAALEKLLSEAQDFARREKKEEPTIARVFRGGQRQLQALNPNISLTGDFYGSVSSSDCASIKNGGEYSDGRNRFFMREAEFHVIAPLDPFTRGKFFLGVPGDGHLEIGEAYMEWLNLPFNTNLKIGMFATQFGILNRWHDHGLPQVDRPKTLVHLFGLENFGGVGAGANFLLPKLWAHVNELDLEVVTGGDGISFDEAYDNVIVVSHLKNYYDLTRNTYLEIGLSGAHGYNDKSAGDRTTLGGLDLAYKWSPAGRSHYRTVEFRNEFFLSHRETFNKTLNRLGFYSYISNKMGARYWIGIRYGYSELPWETEKEYEWDITPYLDFWQSEFVMMRLQYSYTHRSYEENDHSVFLQSVWSMGPHKHEAY